eukprot:CFRG1326T1
METMVVTDRDLLVLPLEGDDMVLDYKVNLVVMQYADGTEIIHDTLEEFMKHVLYTMHPVNYAGWVFVAHNAASFDLKFVVKYCLENALAVTPLTTGRKTRQLRIPMETHTIRKKRGLSISQDASTFDPYRTLTWIDSYAFLPFAGPILHAFDRRACLYWHLTNMDVDLALERGYRILNVYELHVYESSSSDLFKEYMQANILLKLQSSLQPDNVQEVIEACANTFDIRVRAEEFRPNPAQRELAKLMINSLWGKCAERMNFIEKRICHSFQDVQRILTLHPDGFKEVDLWTDLPNVCVMSFEHDKDTVKQPKSYHHPHLACFTTSMARAYLYRTSIGFLHPSQVMYADTDSVVFVYDRQNPAHKMMDCSKGYLLGEYKDELSAGERMKRFYALAPKTYAYEHTIPDSQRAEIDREPNSLNKQLRLQSATECGKMKGFSLSTDMALQCNVDGFKKMVEGEVSEFIQDRPYAIGRSAQMNIPLVHRERKVLRKPLYVKRRILPSQDLGSYTVTHSQPWGY